MYGAMMFRRLRHRLNGKAKYLQILEGVLILYSLDYLFRLAVEMKTLGLPWTIS